METAKTVELIVNGCIKVTVAVFVFVTGALTIEVISILFVVVRKLVGLGIRRQPQATDSCALGTAASPVGTAAGAATIGSFAFLRNSDEIERTKDDLQVESKNLEATGGDLDPAVIGVGLELGDDVDLVEEGFPTEAVSPTERDADTGRAEEEVDAVEGGLSDDIVVFVEDDSSGDDVILVEEGVSRSEDNVDLEDDFGLSVDDLELVEDNSLRSDIDVDIEDDGFSPSRLELDVERTEEDSVERTTEGVERTELVLAHIDVVNVGPLWMLVNIQKLYYYTDLPNYSNSRPNNTRPSRRIRRQSHHNR